jgi:hypothetical protein
MTFFGKQVEADGLARINGVVDADGDGDQGELDVSFPDCSHNKVVRLKNESGAAKLLKMLKFKNSISIFN